MKLHVLKINPMATLTYGAMDNISGYVALALENFHSASSKYRLNKDIIFNYYYT